MTDRYEMAFQIGEDAFGPVYLANDTMLKRRVMMRHISYGNSPELQTRDDSWREEFNRYAGKLSTKQHPNMLALYDISVDADKASIVTQYVEGQSLAERLAKGPLGQSGVYKMAADMLDMLHSAHASNIFHGALHTGSIRRVPRAAGGHRYLLMDLGLNHLASMVKAQKMKVVDPVLVAPEMYDPEHELDIKADLFMFGQLCYTALANAHPLLGKSVEERLRIYQDTGMPHLRHHSEGVNAGFAAWVMTMVEVDPRRRPINMADAIAQLEAVDLGEPEPNVAGETQAVEKIYVETAPEPVEKKSDLVMQTQGQNDFERAKQDSVRAAAANSAAASRKRMEEQRTSTLQGPPVAHQVKGGRKSIKIWIILILLVALIGGGAWAFKDVLMDQLKTYL